MSIASCYHSQQLEPGVGGENINYKYSPAGKWVHKMKYIRTMEYYATIKSTHRKPELHKIAMGFKIFMLSDRSQGQNILFT